MFIAARIADHRVDLVLPSTTVTTRVVGYAAAFAGVVDLQTFTNVGDAVSTDK